MIAYIEGKLTYKSPAEVYIEVNGLGYAVQISFNTYSKIEHLEKCKLWTFLQIKEDAHTLYGFFYPEEKSMFLSLITVSGIGASTARMILSSMLPEEVRAAIINEDVKLFQTVKGIGAKTAKRIILELKDKMIKNDDTSLSLMGKPRGESNGLHGDALNALIALGISRNMADKAVRKALKGNDRPQTLERIIKEALKNI